MKRLFVVALALAGCNSGPKTNADLNHAASDIECTYAARCGLIGKSQLQSCQDLGRAYYDKYGSVYNAPVDAEITAGRVSIDGSAANTCLGAFDSLTCSGNSPINTSAACAGIYRGLVKAGDLCNLSTLNECAAGYCSFASNSECGGTCTSSYLAEGASCQGLSYGCDPKNDYCNTTSDTCQPRGTAGTRCSSYTDCASDLICNDDVCSKVPQGGQPCTNNSGCSDGYYCPDVVTGTATCTSKVGTNGPCTDAAACPDGNVCARGVNSDGICLPLLDVGDVCDPGRSACPSSTICQGTTCALPDDPTGKDCGQGTTESCQLSGSLFPSPLYCDQGSHKCTAQKNTGDSCDPQAIPSGCYGICDSDAHTCTAPSLNTCP